MYIKVIHKNEKTYYILCVCDAKTKVWAERFIDEPMALRLYKEFNVRTKMKEVR